MEFSHPNSIQLSQPKLVVAETLAQAPPYYTTSSRNYNHSQDKTYAGLWAGIKEVHGHNAVLTSGVEVPFGMMVWSTGVKQVPVIEKLSADEVGKARNGRLFVDEHLKVLTKDGDVVGGGKVFAMGDCAADKNKPLPPLAQVASQQAAYLAKKLNSDGLAALSGGQDVLPFAYAHLGSMASVGEWKGVWDSTNIAADKAPDGVRKKKIPTVKGTTAFLLWRAAYWTRQVSITNKILIPMYWFKSMLFGRDISRF